MYWQSKAPKKDKIDFENGPWLYDASGKQVTPSIKGQKIEAGRARDNNARRFAKQKGGLYVVLNPVKSPEKYMKIPALTEEDDDNDDGGNGDDEMDTS